MVNQRFSTLVGHQHRQRQHQDSAGQGQAVAHPAGELHSLRPAGISRSAPAPSRADGRRRDFGCLRLQPVVDHRLGFLRERAASSSLRVRISLPAFSAAFLPLTEPSSKALPARIAVSTGAGVDHGAQILRHARVSVLVHHHQHRRDVEGRRAGELGVVMNQLLDLRAGTTSHGTTTPSITPDASDSGTCGTGIRLGWHPAVSDSPARRFGTGASCPAGWRGR